MQYQTLYEFYWFGTCHRYLLDVVPGMPITGRSNVHWNIEKFFGYLKNLKLKVTSRVAENLLQPIEEELRSAAEKATITNDQAKKLRNAIQSIQITLDAELLGIGAYTPTPKRLDLNHLLKSVEELFAPNVFSNLPELAQYDLREAGRCIAFELPTAAAFHILRSTEAVLRHYYKGMIRQNRIANEMWGPIVADLRSKRKTSGNVALNNHLDNIRSSFRNPTQHPEARYDIHEVQDLWAVCVDVINRMQKTLNEEGA